MISDKPQDSPREHIRKAAHEGDVRHMLDAIRDLLAISTKSADIAFAASRVREIGADTARKHGLIPLRAFLVRSVTVEPFLPHLVVYGVLAGLWLDITVGGYGSFIDELMNPDGVLKQNEPDVVLFLSDVEDLAGGLRKASASGDHAAIQKALEAAQFDVRNLLGQFRSHCTARILVQGLAIPDEPALGDVTDANLGGGEVRAIQQINVAMAAECRKIGDAVFFDHDQVASRFGRARWRDHRMFYANRLALAVDAFAPFAEGLARALRTLYFAPKKVLCTDLDDTLWGGIIGEDGVDGIATGTAFPGICYLEYQRYLKQLASRGVLLAIASKNNEADVIEAFDRRSNDMALALQDFVARRIGWQDKISCLPEMAQELSLGLDAFVFVDDNPVECAAMRQQLPQVTVIHVDRERPWDRVNQISSLGLFDSLIITDDDRNRIAEYKAQTQRADLEATSISREDFLASLNIVCTVLDAQDAPLSRTAQLISKTNQFNLTTRRHTANDVEQMAKQPGSIALALRAQDRFGDAGVIGVALCRMIERACYIDTFLLSCRVIGRGIETALLSYIAERAKSYGAEKLLGEYIPSKKNSMCSDFYPKHGFTSATSALQFNNRDSRMYELGLTSSLPERPAWITIEEEFSLTI